LKEEAGVADADVALPRRDDVLRRFDGENEVLLSASAGANSFLGTYEETIPLHEIEVSLDTLADGRLDDVPVRVGDSERVGDVERRESKFAPEGGLRLTADETSMPGSRSCSSPCGEGPDRRTDPAGRVYVCLRFTPVAHTSRMI
jgi:hypothetical protein